MSKELNCLNFKVSFNSISPYFGAVKLSPVMLLILIEFILCRTNFKDFNFIIISNVKFFFQINKVCNVRHIRKISNANIHTLCFYHNIFLFLHIENVPPCFNIAFVTFSNNLLRIALILF